MTRKLLTFFLLFPHALTAEVKLRVQNSNFTISQAAQMPQEKSTLYNYERLRIQSDYIHDNFFATLIADGVNYTGHEYINSTSFTYLKNTSSDTPFKTQTPFNNSYDTSSYAKVYRAYAGYDNLQNRIVAGVINISMGVGRIWTPTNLFNPKNIYALESDETFGVAALSYTKNINDTSNLNLVISQKKDNTIKYAARYKAFLDFSDVALDVIYSDTTKMFGYELEGNLADTGVEIRSEGAYIKSSLKDTSNTSDKEFFQGILGADYGFENGVTAVFETLYSSKKFNYQQQLLNLDSDILTSLVNSNFYGATSISYSFNIFLDASMVYIESLERQNSRFFSPTLTYTLNDYNTFNIGALLYNGGDGSEFESIGNTYYFRWNLSF